MARGEESLGELRYFKATIEYDGTDFCGYQWQHGKRTVQSAFEKALLKRTGQEVRIEGAGRTDSGVHGLGQVVSFACETRIPVESMALALNSALPRDLTVKKVEEVPPTFHARFSASSRIYIYLIFNRRTPSALWHRYSAFCPVPLDVSAMQETANLLLGERDFAAFANQLDDEKTTMRDVMSCRVRRHHDFVIARVEANAFLRGMVRNIVGTLMEAGEGKRSPHSIPEVLASRDRKLAGPSAPPQGLYLLRVRYGERKQYPRRKERDTER